MGCVKKFYPDSKVNILAHSMGNYIARRYILDNPNVHGVKKMVAIAAPWLGTPRSLYILETGKFFNTGNFLGDYFGNRLFAPLFKSLAEFFPSVHQTLPSRPYYDLGGHEFGEISGSRNWDVNGNGRLDNDYTPEEVAALLDNIQFKQSKPGQTGSSFHSKPGQDDWRTDQSGVLYYLLYGVQYYRFTIGKVLAVNKFQFDSQGQVVQVHDYEVTYTQGDGTAPLLSTERIGRGLDLNGSAVKRIPFVSTHDHFKDDIVEHTALTANPDVWDAILNSLKSTSQQARAEAPPRDSFSMHHASSIFRGSSLPLQEPTTLDSGEAYYSRITGADRVTVTDAQGNSNSQIEDTPFDLPVPGVLMSENQTSADVNFGAELSADQSYTLTFHSLGKPIEIDLAKGKGNTPANASQIIRYLDVNLPAGTEIMLKITAFGVENMRYDADGDGVFESAMEPTAFAIGEAARDTQAPVIAFSELVMGTNRLITINATDDASGVKIVRYSLDGERYQAYSGPISVSACETRTVYAVADDNVANRSDISMYEIPNLAPDVSQARPSVTMLWPPDHQLVPISILGVTDPDCDPITITVTRITQDEPTNNTGDGDTCPDAQGIGTPSVQLRAERKGTGNGRVYTIYFSATDGKGGVSQGTIKVGVPKTGKSSAIDDGIALESTICGSP